jgi:hypothetical protein
MICLYKGARGKGKTLTMVRDAKNFYKNGYKIITNLEVTFGEKMSNEDILELDKNSKIFNAVLVIDEIQIFFDSRRHARKENLNFSNFIQQTRKRNIHILCTTQYSNTIDLRLRQHLDIVAFPNFIKELNLCEVNYVDITSLENDFLGDYMKEAIKLVKIVYDARPIFKLYKTEQMII